MRVAAIDLGTNTFLLLVADVENGKIKKVIYDDVQVVRLGQGVHSSRRLHPDALLRANNCFESFAQKINEFGAVVTQAFATSAARDVENKQDLINLGLKHAIPIEIISGEREAELTYLGARDGDEVAAGTSAIIIDVGGGSTEVIYGKGQKVLQRVSIDVGSVRLSEMFVKTHPIVKSTLDEMSEYILKKLAGSLVDFPKDRGQEVLAVAGTPTTLATLELGHSFESDRVHGLGLPVSRLRYWVEHLAKMTVDERQKLAGMDPKRADVIVAGTLVLCMVSEALRAENLKVSIRGLRYGIAKILS